MIFFLSAKAWYGWLFLLLGFLFTIVFTIIQSTINPYQSSGIFLHWIGFSLSICPVILAIIIEIFVLKRVIKNKDKFIDGFHSIIVILFCLLFLGIITNSFVSHLYVFSQNGYVPGFEAGYQAGYEDAHNNYYPN